MAYRIGSFNMYKFSYRSDDEIRKDMELIAGIIREQQFDIIALQEVFSKSAMEQLLNWLGRYRWEGVWESPVSYSSLAAEGYAFIWDKTKFRLATTTLPDGTTRKFQPHIYKQYKVDRSLGQQQLIRNPFYGRFEPLYGAFCELRLINTHIMFAKHSSGNGALDSLANFGAVSMRRHEFDILTKALYSSISDKVYGNNRPSYTIILGDYNLNLPSSGARTALINEIVEVGEGGKTKRIVTVQNEMTTLKSRTDNAQNVNDNEPMSYWANNYDHFSFDIDRFAGIKYESHRIDTVKEYTEDDYERHRKIVSDHVPVKLDINLK